MNRSTDSLGPSSLSPDIAAEIAFATCPEGERVRPCAWHQTAAEIAAMPPGTSQGMCGPCRDRVLAEHDAMLAERARTGELV